MMRSTLSPGSTIKEGYNAHVHCVVANASRWSKQPHTVSRNRNCSDALRNPPFHGKVRLLHRHWAWTQPQQRTVSRVGVENHQRTWQILCENQGVDSIDDNVGFPVDHKNGHLHFFKIGITLTDRLAHSKNAAAWAGKTLSLISVSRFSTRASRRFRNARPAAWLSGEGVKKPSIQKSSGVLRTRPRFFNHCNRPSTADRPRLHAIMFRCRARGGPCMSLLIAR
jgi:hypothetical protein